MRRYTRATVPTHWHVAEVARVRGQVLTPGRELRVRGERGRFRFVRHVRNVHLDTEWIDVYGGPAGHETLRSFRPEWVTRVLRTQTMRPTTDPTGVAA